MFLFIIKLVPVKIFPWFRSGTGTKILAGSGAGTGTGTGTSPSLDHIYGKGIPGANSDTNKMLTYFSE